MLILTIFIIVFYYVKLNLKKFSPKTLDFVSGCFLPASEPVQLLERRGEGDHGRYD